MIPVRLGFAFLARPMLGADALWLSYPVSTVVNLGLAILYYKKGAWRSARMVAQPSRVELVEEANSGCEPGGRIMPSA